MFFIYLIDVDIVDITSKFPLQRNPFHSEFVFHYYFFLLPYPGILNVMFLSNKTPVFAEDHLTAMISPLAK